MVKTKNKQLCNCHNNRVQLISSITLIAKSRLNICKQRDDDTYHEMKQNYDLKQWTSKAQHSRTSPKKENTEQCRKNSSKSTYITRTSWLSTSSLYHKTSFSYTQLHRIRIWDERKIRSYFCGPFCRIRHRFWRQKLLWKQHKSETAKKFYELSSLLFNSHLKEFISKTMSALFYLANHKAVVTVKLHEHDALLLVQPHLKYVWVTHFQNSHFRESHFLESEQQIRTRTSLIYNFTRTKRIVSQPVVRSSALALCYFDAEYCVPKQFGFDQFILEHGRHPNPISNANQTTLDTKTG